eukprot:scaffold115889_cov18-Tisochrysis_lutea.AAC.1
MAIDDLKSTLEVRSSTSSWSVLHECGIKPIQFNGSEPLCERTAPGQMESPSAIGMLADNSAAREYLSLLPRLWMPPLETSACT